jgi:hypothetical protein
MPVQCKKDELRPIPAQARNRDSVSISMIFHDVKRLDAFKGSEGMSKKFIPKCALPTRLGLCQIAKRQFVHFAILSWILLEIPTN